MKQIVLFSLAFAALGLVSCKKERTCTCNVTSTQVTNTTGLPTNTQTSTGSYVEVLPKATKGTAKSKKDCISRTQTSKDTYTYAGVTTTTDYTDDYSCTIK